MKTNICLLFLIFLLPHGHSASQHDSETTGPFSLQKRSEQAELQHEVTVTLKLIRVFVTDNQGNPVPDLEKSDFILYDNGRLQNITDFERHVLPTMEKPVGTERAPQEPIITPRRARKFFIILDYGQRDVRGLFQSKKAALHFMETKLLPGDAVGVLSYHFHRGLVLHQYLTSDIDRAREAVRNIKGVVEAGGGLPLGPPSVSEGDPGESYFATGALVDPSGADEEDRRSRKAKTLEFITTLKELAKALASLPEPKYIILFSSGISAAMLYDPYDSSIREFWEHAAMEFGASGVPVFPVDTSSMASRSLGESDALKMLADHSGGRYIHEARDYEKVAALIHTITGNYYVLGYYVDEKYDGQYHEVRVKIRRKGCRVYVQSGYFNPRPFYELSPFEKQLHLIALVLGEEGYYGQPLSFPSVALVSSRSPEAVKTVILSEIKVPGMTEIVRGGAEIWTLAFDERNDVVDVARGELRPSILEKSSVYHFAVLSLPVPLEGVGRYECRVLIRNTKTGRAARSSFTVEVPVIPEPARGLFLFPPILLVREDGVFYVESVPRSRAKKMEKKTQGTPERFLSLKEIYPFVSMTSAPVIHHLNREEKRVTAVLRCRVGSVTEPDVRLSVYMKRGVHPEGEKVGSYKGMEWVEVPCFLEDVQKGEAGVDALLLTIELPELEPGPYTFEFRAEETTTGSQAATTVSFEVV